MGAQLCLANLQEINPLQYKKQQYLSGVQVSQPTYVLFDYEQALLCVCVCVSKATVDVDWHCYSKDEHLSKDVRVDCSV